MSQPKTKSADFGANRSITAIGPSASGDDLCVVTDDNAVICSGNVSPPFVDGNNQMTPLTLGTTNAPVSVASGSALCVVFADQSLRCTGDNSYGQAGFGASRYDRPPPGETVLQLAH